MYLLNISNHFILSNFTLIIGHKNEFLLTCCKKIFLKVLKKISDNYLSKKDLRMIQKTAYKVSEWFDTDEILEYISYQGVNVGSLIQDELINILVNYTKKFFGMKKFRIFPTK